jgi:serine O-acetyltransferase
VIGVILADLRRVGDPGARYQTAEWRWSKILVAVATHQGVWAVLEYRFRRWATGLPGALRWPLAVFGLFTRKAIESLAGISISTRAEFGPGLFIGHFGGIIIGEDVTVGANCSLSQDVTLGAHRGSPRIGDCLYLAPGAKVFGPIEIGDNVAVGANAVVNTDVPSFATVVAGGTSVLEGRGNQIR